MRNSGHNYPQGHGKEALKSIKEIRKHLTNPQLLNYKNGEKPAGLAVDEMRGSASSNVWRNAYYLSTTIEESNQRKVQNNYRPTQDGNQSHLDDDGTADVPRRTQAPREEQKITTLGVPPGKQIDVDLP